MFVGVDRFVQRVRAAGRGEEGASLVIVIAYMAMAFVVATVIAAACLAAIQQNVRSESSVQAFAAAEAGRDDVEAALEMAPESCPSTATYTDDPDDPGDLTFTVTLHPTTSATAPTKADGIPVACPRDDDKWVVLRSTGTGADGKKTTVDAVYPWQRFRKEVAGGALGYMDASYSTSLSSVSGDTVIKHGDFTCTVKTKFDGNVFLLDGNVNIPSPDVLTGLLSSGEPFCDITGDLIVNGNITIGKKTTLLFIFQFLPWLRVGGQVKASGNIDTQGKLETGVVASRPYHDVAAGGRIYVHDGSAELTVGNGGSIKSQGDIDIDSGKITAAGAIATNANLLADASVQAGGPISAVQSITGGGAVTAGASIAAGGSISGGARTANGGSMTAVGNIDGSGARTASVSVLAGGDISTSGNVAANGGDIQAGGSVSGGTRTAAGSVLARYDISSGNITANGGDVWAGRNMSGGARTASRSVLAVGDISAGAITANGGDIRSGGSITGNANRTASGAISARGSITSNNAIQAKSGGITADGDITGSGARIAGTGSGTSSNMTGITTAGDIKARGRIESTGGTAAVNVMALGNIKVDAACKITGNVHASGTLTYDDVVDRQKSGWNSPTCAVGGNFWSSSGSKSTLPTYKAPSNNNRSDGTFPNIRIPSTSSVRVSAGWTAAASFIASNGAVTQLGTAATGTNPGAPTIGNAPTVAAPTLAPITAPTPFTIVYNEDPDGTWESFDDLQLRTTWVDLGTYTTWTGYTVIPPLTGSQCSGSWFNPGGYISTILSTPGVVRINGSVIAPANVPVVIDATACGTVNMGWSSFNLARDAVILVYAANFNVAPFRATNLAAGETRQLYVVQTDLSNAPRPPAWGGDPEPVPDCTLPPTPPTSRPRINMIGTGFGGLAWDDRVNVLLYSPCGINGKVLSEWHGHIYVHNDSVVSDVLGTMVCEPMVIPGVVDLPCDINEVSTLGSMNVNAWMLGDRYSQTEE